MREGRGKKRGNTLCDSSNRWHEIPAAQQAPARQEKTPTSGAADRSEGNKRAKDRVPRCNTRLRKRATWRKCRIPRAEQLPGRARPTRHRAATCCPGVIPAKELAYQPCMYLREEVAYAKKFIFETKLCSGWKFCFRTNSVQLTEYFEFPHPGPRGLPAPR